VSGVSRPALFAVLLLALAHLALFQGYLTDDSFIHFQFAKHLIAGQGFAFNAGEPTYGATSPLWVLLLAASGALVSGSAATPASASVVPEIAWIAKAWGALFSVLAGVWFVRLGKTLGWGGPSALALGALLAAHAWSARWAVSGMETALAVLLVIAALELLARVLEGRGNSFVAGVLLGLAVLARPECWLLLGMGLLAIAVGSGGSAGVRVPRAARATLGAAVPILPWLVFAWASFHRLLPNTSAAKAVAFLHPDLALDAIRTSIRIVLATDLLPLALSVVAAGFAGFELLREAAAPRRAFWLLVAAWPVSLVLGLAAGGVQVVSRYLLPAVPSILLLGVASFAWASSRLDPRRRAGALALLVALYIGQNAFVTLRYSAPHARRHTAGLLSSLGAFGTWARENTPPGTVFAIPDIGAFGFYSDRPVLDLFGLVTPEMAPITVHEGYDAVVSNLLFERVGRPTYLIDRARDTARLFTPDDPTNPYRSLSSKTIPDLGLTRPGAYVYSLYRIEWDVYDTTHPRIAAGIVPPGIPTGFR